MDQVNAMCRWTQALCTLLFLDPAAAYVAATPPRVTVSARPGARSTQMQLDVLAAVDSFYQTQPIQAAFVDMWCQGLAQRHDLTEVGRARVLANGPSDGAPFLLLAQWRLHPVWALSIRE